MSDRADLVIIGAGTLGGWASVFAAADGVGKVVVLERGLAGMGASSRAAGHDATYLSCVAPASPPPGGLTARRTRPAPPLKRTQTALPGTPLSAAARRRVRNRR